MPKAIGFIRQYMKDNNLTEINYETMAQQLQMTDTSRLWNYLQKSSWFEKTENNGIFRLVDSTKETIEFDDTDKKPTEVVDVKPDKDKASTKLSIIDKCVICGVSPKRSETAKTCNQHCAGYLAHQTRVAMAKSNT